MKNSRKKFFWLIFTSILSLSFFDSYSQSGRVFYDVNNNQIQDNNELGYVGLVVKVFPKDKEVKPENCLAVVKTDNNGDFNIPPIANTEFRIIISESKDYCSDNSPKFKSFCLIADFLTLPSSPNLLIAHNPQYRRGGVISN